MNKKTIRQIINEFHLATLITTDASGEQHAYAKHLSNINACVAELEAFIPDSEARVVAK